MEFIQTMTCNSTMSMLLVYELKFILLFIFWGLVQVVSDGVTPPKNDDNLIIYCMIKKNFFLENTFKNNCVIQVSCALHLFDQKYS